MTATDDTAASEGPACSLTPEGRTARAGEWRALAGQALRRRVEADRVVNVYPNRPEIAQRLARLVAAEKDCCPFLDFGVRHDEEEITVVLRYPPQFGATVAALLAAGQRWATKAT